MKRIRSSVFSLLMLALVSASAFAQGRRVRGQVAVEGSGEPLPYYESLLADVDDETRDRFLGGSIAEAYDRMGDPL